MRAVFVALLLVGCTPPSCPTHAPGGLPLGADAGELCVMACDRAAACGCGFAVDVNICVAACRLDQSQGSAANLDPVCLANAATCSQVQICAPDCK